MDKKLSRIGVVLTSVYFLLVATLVIWRFESLPGMPLNEVGDFLAGVFGPIAILWLILGFFQQGEELRQNNQALLLQAQELNNSVAQQKEMVSVSRGQLDLQLAVMEQSRVDREKSLLPNIKLYFEHSGNDTRGLVFRVACKNVGFLAEEFKVLVEGPSYVNLLLESPSLITEEQRIADLVLANTSDRTSIIVRYKDGLARFHTVVYLMGFVSRQDGFFSVRLNETSHASD
ncbi:hypothetical protein HNP29_004363 [Pseudomonas alcaligenes]|nr:hypothetical protein [Pseudomonas alcaligenes]